MLDLQSSPKKSAIPFEVCPDRITRVFEFPCGLDPVQFKGPVLLVVVVVLVLVVVFASCEVGQALSPPGRHHS